MKPYRLKRGDTIGIVAPAGPVDSDRLARATPFFEAMGLHVTYGATIDEWHGYLEGTDDQRVADIHHMISDTSVRAIMFARGGYGSARLADKIDYELISRHPKIIWGYSDITYMHTAIRQWTGLTTFHGPMPASDVADEAFDPLSARMFRQLFAPETLHYTEDVSPLTVLAPGEADGALVGGNVSVLASTLGTDYDIDTNGKLLLLEDIGEAPYRIDSMLNQLRLAGKLDAAAGIIVGDFADAKPTHEPSLSLEQVLADHLSDLPCPVMAGFKIGHCFPHFSVPLGARAFLSTTRKRLTIEPGVQ
ncbi:LD-carboxypeptidase [Lentibacillus halophilus]|uniref:LD-carboxypeptidase n=1 Tax=Lentibacillus halophilus TaxID=295065 RepID=A0ABN0Z7B7_9BACI